VKRAMLALIGLFCVINLAAQDSQVRSQRGNATQEMRARGLSAAHSRIPLGSKVRVTNPANGLEIEVTIVEQMLESTRRIIDLSPSAASALEIGAGGPVIVTPLTQPQPAPSNVKVTPPPEEKVIPEKVVPEEPEKPQLPFNITIYNYIMNPDNPAQPEEKQERPVRKNRNPRDVEIQPNASAQNDETPELRAEAPEQPAVAQHPVQPAEDIPPAQPPVQPLAQAPAQPPVQPAVEEPVRPPAQPEAPPSKPPLFTAPPVHNIRIIPDRLPDPHSDKTYRLLVGTYPGVDSAFLVYQQLRAAGFDVAQEQAGEMCRVFAAGIPASQVYYAAQRLGAIGFEQVWVQE